jgi:hypothetical protein
MVSDLRERIKFVLFLKMIIHNEIRMIIFYRTSILNFIELQHAFLKITNFSKFRQGVMSKMDAQVT